MIQSSTFPLLRSIRGRGAQTPLPHRTSAAQLGFALALLTSALPWTALRAQTLSTAEFFGNTLNSARSLGTSVAITETLILAGRPAAFSTGEVLVLDARTGVQRRILRSPLPPGTPDDFGRSMAASGNLALIGAPDVGNRGAAYLMNPSTGALIQFLQPIALNPNDLFGMSVAMTGSFLVVGAPETADVAGLNQGAVYVFEARTGNLIHRLLAPDAAAGDRFGASVAVSGHYVAVGAPSKNAGAGRAYVFDARTGDSFRFPDPSALFAGDQYGTSVAISGSLLIAGAPGAGGGNGRVVVMDIPAAVELFSQNGGGSYGHRVAAHGRFFAVSSLSATSTRTRQGYVAVFESTLRTPGPVPFRLVAQCSHPFPTADNEFLGSAIALNADTLVAGVPGRTHIAAAVGSVVRFGPFASQLDRFANPPGHHEVARSGDTTPDRAGSAFSGFTQLAAGPSSGLSSPRLVVDAALTGRRAGWCANTNLDGNLYTLNRTGDALTPGVNVIDFLNPITNVAERTVVRAMLRGPAVTAASNEAILLSIQRAPFPMVRKGDAVLGGQVSRLGQPRMGTAGFVTLNAKLNAAATADSGLYVYTTDGTFVACRIEGSAAPGLGAIPLGEFANRMATQSSFTAYTTALQTAPALNQAIFKDAALLAQRGTAAPGTGFGPVFSTFLGESINGFLGIGGETVFRATLSGPGVNATNNEGLWSDRNGGVVNLVVRKGDAIPGLPLGVVLHRILNFGIASSGHVLVHAQLRGTGINASNDGAIMSYGLTGNFWMLAREGDTAPGCGTARFATFNLLHSNGSGQYALLATLTDSTAANNLALFQGQNTLVFFPSPSVSTAQPKLLTRKGDRFERTGSSLLKSIALPGYLTDGSGASATGLANLTGPFGETAAVLTFTDNQSAAVVLKP